MSLQELAISTASPGSWLPNWLDQAGWHGATDLRVPKNLSLLPLPPRAPELNPQENIWQTVCSFLDGGRGGAPHYETIEGCAGLADAEPHSQGTIHAGNQQSLCRS